MCRSYYGVRCGGAGVEVSLALYLAIRGSMSAAQYVFWSCIQFKMLFFVAGFTGVDTPTYSATPIK